MTIEVKEGRDVLIDRLLDEETPSSILLVLINVPPRVGKTRLVSRLFVAWFIDYAQHKNLCINEALLDFKADNPNCDLIAYKCKCRSCSRAEPA